MAQRLPQVRVFALGIDRSVNAGFLERLAALGDGACELVESEERLDDAMDRMHRRIATPIYTDLRLEAEGFQMTSETTTPSRLPVLFDGTAVVVSGRYQQRTSAAQLILHAVDASGSAWSAVVPAVHTENASLAVHWARGHMRDLEDQYIISNRAQRPDLETRIIDTSLRFHVLSRFTAFVAIDRAEQVIVDGNLHRTTQPVEMPAGWQPSQAIMHGLMNTALVAGRDKIQASAQALPYSTEPSELPYTAPHAADKLRPALPIPWDQPGEDHTPDRTRPDIWRRRARELAKRASRASLSTLATELEALVNQLRANGFNKQDIKSLDDVRQALQAHLDGTRQDKMIVQRVQTALYAFSERFAPEESSALQTRSKTFWKADL